MRKAIGTTFLTVMLTLFTMCGCFCALVNVELRPTSRAVHQGEQVGIGLYLVSQQENQGISATDVILTHNSAQLRYSSLSSVGAPYEWMMDGFIGAGINADIRDGDMQYSAWSMLGDPAQATSAGLLATTLVFDALAPTAHAVVAVPAQLGEAITDVFSANEGNLDVKGQLIGTDILIAPPGVVSSALQLKKLAVSSIREVQGPAVTRVFAADRSFYMEDPLRVSGIRVVLRPFETLPAENETPSVFGVLKKTDGEYVLDEAVVVPHAGSCVILPMMANNRDASRSVGLDMTGLLLKAIGRVSVSSPSATEFSMVYDGRTNGRLRISLQGVAPPPDQSMCFVTGCLGSDASGRVLRVCKSSDIEVVPEAP